jgi:uncharacterized protein with GYD domain
MAGRAAHGKSNLSTGIRGAAPRRFRASLQAHRSGRSLDIAVDKAKPAARRGQTVAHGNNHGVKVMATTYVCLLNWTQKGIENVKQSPSRLDAAREAFAAEGATLRDFYLTVGPYDMVCVAEAPDDAVVARILLKLGSQGGVRTTTLRAFPEAEYRKIVQSL